MANQGEAVEVVIDRIQTLDVILDEQREFIIGVKNEPGWTCHSKNENSYFLAWNGKLYILDDPTQSVLDAIDLVGEAPTWRALLKETAQALSPETNYGAW